ncbi:MAG: VCBS repeat-containing protein [Chloroflexota bacterium]
MPSTPRRARSWLADRAPVRALVLALVLLLALADIVPASGAGETALAQPSDTTPTSACDTDGPTLDTTFGRSILTSIVTDDDAAWAVGMTTLAEDPRYALAVEWDGDGWPVMPMRRPKAEQALFAVDRGPRGSLWAAGYRSSAGGYRPLLMRLAQGRWIPMGLGKSGRKTGVLTGVVAVTDRVVWAVGYRGATGGQRPFALRHTESGWSEENPPLAGGSDGALMDVDSARGGETWVVGWVSLRGAPHPYAARRVRGRWQVVRPSLRNASEGVLTSVAVAPGGKAWAVGYKIAGGRYVPIVERWTGSRWRSVGMPTDGDAITLLRAVQLDAEGRPIVAGTRWDPATGGWRGIVGRYASGEWTVVDAPELPGGSELRDVAEGPDGEVLAVGANGRRSLTFGVCPGQTVVAPGPTPSDGGPPAPVGTTAPSVPQRTTPPEAQPTPTAPLAASSAAPPGAAATPAPGTAAAPASPTPTKRPAKPSPLPNRRGGYRVVARDVAASVGLDRKSTSTYGGVKVDIDGDGWPDLLVGRHSNAAWLLMNRGAHFSMAKGVAFPGIDRHGCTAGDANGDGRPDLFCATGALHGAGVKTDELWIQQADGTFRDEAIDLRVADPVGRGRLATFFDLDHDRYADLFIANRPDRTDGLPSRHRVLANPDGEGYEPRSVLGIDAASGADCVVPADLDRDGWEDIVLCERAIGRPDGQGIRVLRNVKGRLADVTGRVGIPAANVVDATVADIDRDGVPDIVQITPWELRVWVRRGDRYVTGYRRSLTSAVAVASGDVNGDGAPDLYVVQGTMERQTRDLMLVNSGDGSGFRSMSIPQARSGSAEDVVAIDHDRNGLADFLVLNGRGSTRAGPIQLIAFYPASAARTARKRNGR